MNLRRFLCPESISLELTTLARPSSDEGDGGGGEDDDDFDEDSENNVRRVREDVLTELATLLDASGRIVNPRRLQRDLVHREKRAITALGSGLAIPHCRTLQARTFTMAFGRSAGGLPFAAPDGERVRLFFALAAPPHDDRTYLQVYRVLAQSLLDPEVIDQLLEVTDPSEVLYILKHTD